MIRFAHPFGAVLRTFSALRATSGVRRDDGSDFLQYSNNGSLTLVPLVLTQLNFRALPPARQVPMPRHPAKPVPSMVSAAKRPQAEGARPTYRCALARSKSAPPHRPPPADRDLPRSPVPRARWTDAASN